MKPHSGSTPTRILFQGLGGAGQRHLRIFRELLPEAEMYACRHTGRTPLLNPDFTIDDSASLTERYRIDLLGTMDEAWARKPDFVVIAKPSIFHAAASIEAAAHGASILVEKPGAIENSQALAVDSAVRRSGVNYFISFQRRFHPLVQRMHSVLKSGELGSIMSVRINVSSHVPDWHPYEDFRDLYACRKELGGGVLSTECHEIDLLNWFFGPPHSVCSLAGRRGPYAIDVDDSAELLLDYRDFGAVVSLSYMQMNQERKISISGQRGWLECDLLAQRLTYGDNYSGNVATYDDSIGADDLFRVQALHFLNHFHLRDYSYLDALVNLATVIDLGQHSTG